MTIHTVTSSDLIIKCFYKVYNELGYGFLEKIYERAFVIELTNQGISCSAQAPIQVYYEGVKIGDYFADIVVNEEIILELKTGEAIVRDHELQLINYLKATDVEGWLSIQLR